MRQRMLSTLFKTWTVQSRHSAYIQQCYEKAAFYFANIMLVKGFASWKKFGSDLAWKKEAIIKAICMWKQNFACRPFLQWQMYVKHRKGIFVLVRNGITRVNYKRT
jgi:hypothetical protein